MAVAPAIVAIGAVVSVAASLAGGMMQAQQAQAQAKAASQAADFNAAVQRNNQLIHERNAQMERQIGEYNMRQDKRRQEFRRSGLSSKMASQGLLAEADDVMFTQLFNDSAENLGTKFNAEIAARREMIAAQDASNQALLYDYRSRSAIAEGKNAASAAMFSGVTGAVQAGISGAGSVYNSVGTARNTSALKSTPTFG